MKLNGILGKGSGKLGSSVFAISGGEQLVREYNPNVSNPNTDAQVDQRAKFKLMSQLAADLASVIVIPKDGLVSARNKFVSKNIALATAENGTASINYVGVQLTASESAFPAVTGSIDSNNVLGVELAKMPAADVQKVVYCVFAKDDTNQLSLVGTTVIDRSEATNNFAYSFADAGDAYVVYAYGIKASAVAANPNYENYEITGATDIARLVASRSITLDASGTTRTSGVLVAAGAFRITKIEAPGLSGDEFEPGSTAGPITLDQNSTVYVYGENFGDNPTVTNAKMKYLYGDEEQTEQLSVNNAYSNLIEFKPGFAGEIDDIYITEITFDVDGVNHGVRFAQP